MSTITYTSDEVFTVEGVTVERHEPDFNDLAWQTFTLLTPGLVLENPGPDEEIARYLIDLLGKPWLYPLGTIYANPCAVVRAEHANGTFLRYARRFQAEWFHRLNQSLFSAERVRRWMDQEDRLARQLIHTGVLIIDNRHIFPDRWPGKPPLSPGARFGWLTVLEPMTQGMVRCQCKCGNVVMKHRKHLNSGGTISCGCRRDQREARLKNQRRDRGWKHSGVMAT